MADRSLTEEALIEEFSSYGWEAEYAQYHLCEEAMEQLAAAADLQAHPQRDAFERAINRTVARFCLGLERYSAYLGDSSSKKITTATKSKAKKIVKASEALLAEIECLNDREVQWIFGHAFEAQTLPVDWAFGQWLAYTSAFRRYAEDARIQTKPSTPAIMRPLVCQCIHILEHFTGETIVRKRADAEAAEHQMIHDFMANLMEALPPQIIALLPQKPSSFEGVVREAIQENNALMNLHKIPSKRF